MNEFIFHLKSRQDKFNNYGIILNQNLTEERNNFSNTVGSKESDRVIFL